MTEWDDAEKRVEKAHELYERGRWEEALHELQAAISINPFNGSWHFNLGLTYDAMDRHEEAIASFKLALEMEPEDVELLNALGYDCNRMGRFDEAIGYFKRIEAIDSSFEPCYCNRIVSYTEKGEYEKAEEMFFLAQQYRENCPQCYYNVGNTAFAQGQYDRALWCWHQVLEISPDHPQVHARIGDALWAKGQLAEAHEHFIEELRCTPGDLDVLLDLGELLVERNMLEAAAEKFRQVLELAPDECTANYHLGMLSMERPDVDDAKFALEQFRRVLKIDRTYSGAHLRIAQIYLQQNDRSEALFHGNCELAQQSNQENILVELGHLFMELDQLASAQTAFKRVVTTNPQNATARHELAVTLLTAGRLDEGIEQARIVLRIQPKFMLAMHNLAMAYLSKKDFTRARYWLREALDIAPEDPQLARFQTRLRLAAFIEGLRSLPRRLFFRK